MDNPFFILEEKLNRLESILLDMQTKLEGQIKDMKEPANVTRPLTTKELCEHLGITEPTVLRWRNKGKIPFFTIGSAVRFDLDKVIKALGK